METCLSLDPLLLPVLTVHEGLHMDVPRCTSQALSIYHALSPLENNCPLAIAQA